MENQTTGGARNPLEMFIRREYEDCIRGGKGIFETSKKESSPDCKSKQSAGYALKSVQSDIEAGHLLSCLNWLD